MKKLGITTIVLVLVVVVIVAVAYLAFVGLTTAAPNVGTDKDPTGQNRGPIAYAVINIHCTVQLWTDWQGSIKSITVNSYPWVNGTQTINQVVKYDPLGLLSSNFEGWVTLRITGPANYIPAVFTSPHEKVTQSFTDVSPRTLDFGPYTAKFYDPGQYTISVQLMTGGGSADKQLASLIQTFTITGI